MSPQTKPLALSIAVTGGLALPITTSYAADPCNPCAPRRETPTPQATHAL